MSDGSPLSSATINEVPPPREGVFLRNGTWVETRGGLTWISTSNIRWRLFDDPMKAGGQIPVLEHAWRCAETGATRWQRVPTVSLPASDQA